MKMKNHRRKQYTSTQPSLVSLNFVENGLPFIYRHSPTTTIPTTTATIGIIISIII